MFAGLEAAFFVNLRDRDGRKLSSCEAITDASLGEAGSPRPPPDASVTLHVLHTLARTHASMHAARTHARTHTHTHIHTCTHAARTHPPFHPPVHPPTPTHTHTGS